MATNNNLQKHDWVLSVTYDDESPEQPLKAKKIGSTHIEGLGNNNGLKQNYLMFGSEALVRGKLKNNWANVTKNGSCTVKVYPVLWQLKLKTRIKDSDKADLHFHTERLANDFGFKMISKEEDGISSIFTMTNSSMSKVKTIERVWRKYTHPQYNTHYISGILEPMTFVWRPEIEQENTLRKHVGIHEQQRRSKL